MMLIVDSLNTFFTNCGFNNRGNRYKNTLACDEGTNNNNHDNQELNINDDNNNELHFLGMEKDLPKIITWRGIVMFAVCVQLGNHFTNWTSGLGAGFWPFIGIIIAILTSFGCEMLCIAEMTSALPFSGGTYGVVRVTLGDLPGYLLGTCEAFQYILYVAFTTYAMAKYVTTMTGYYEKYEPLYWLIMYTAIAALLTFRRSLFWKSMWVFGIYILVMILLYCTMTREKANFDYYIKDPAVGNLSDNQYTYNFFQALPTGGWMFNLASKIMPLTCSETENPTMNVPKAMYIGYAISIVSAFAVVCCAVSISPGLAALRMTRTPLIFGFSEIFDITPLQALSFTLIAMFATCLPYAFAYSVLISSLSKSGFMGPISHLHSCTNSHSYLAGIFSGSILGFILNLVIWNWDKDFLVYLSSGYAILGFSVNLTIFVTYIVFKSKFSTLVKTYESPVGIYGAIYGLVMFSIVFISIGALADRNNRWSTFVLLISFLLVWSAPYFLYYRHNLTYSEEESTIMFIAYVMKANQARRAQNTLLQKRNKTIASPTSTVRHSQHCSSSRTGSVRTKHTYTPTSRSQDSVRVDTLGTDRLITQSNSNDGSAVLEVGAAAKLVNNTKKSSTSSTKEENSKEVELAGSSATCYPSAQSSCINFNSLSPIPESRKLPPLRIEIPPISSAHTGVSVRETRILPINSTATTTVGRPLTSNKSTTRGVSALDSVLTKGLRYDTEAMGRIRTEIQEFYEAQQGEGDEEV